MNNPTAVDGYYGIVSNHVYIKGQDSDAHLSNEVNDRTAFDGEKGYAGLVNTKYTDNYPEDLNDKLASLYDDDDIQPIVIYNKYLDNYGFIGASQSLSSSAYAKVTVIIRTFDNAKAYIYLVDTSKSEKDVLAFADFTVNTNTGIKNAAINGTLVENKKFMLTVNKNTPVGADNWVEVNFYIATGATAKSFRVEIWNGDRTGETKSTGYVFIDSINVNLSSAFAEPASWSKAFSSDSASNPLYTAMLNGFEFDEIIAYERELTETEKQFNKEYPDQTVSYNANYVWATTSTMVYGIFNTIDPVESDPYDNIQEEEDTGCAANTDPSTFWLSFSSFALAAVLILAIITLFVKRIAERRKANKSDIKTQYKVKSRSESQKAINKVKEQQTKMFTETESADDETETTEDASESVTENEEQQAAENDATEQTEESGDDTEQTGYVYGEVQDFGDMTLENPESEKPAENTEEEKKDE